MSVILSAHHTSLEAPTESDLDQSIAQWRSLLEAELIEHRNHPRGVEASYRDPRRTMA